MISLFAIGDYGASTPVRYHVSRLLQKQPKKTAVIGLGDNFYNHGIESSSSPRWKSDFVDAFRPDCPWFTILGNHDYLGNIQAQMDFTRKNRFWKMPSRYYDYKFFFPTLPTSYVHLICLDTFELSLTEAGNNSVGMGMSPDSWYSLRSTLEPQKQLDWLDKKLSESTAIWKIVAGHYSLFSCGSHGDNPELTELLLPLFKKHKVDFYLSGHDHSLQHTNCLETQFLVSGTGCSVSTVRPDSRFFNVPSKQAGACFLYLYPDRCSFGFLSVDSEKPIYQKTLFPRSNKLLLDWIPKKKYKY